MAAESHFLHQVQYIPLVVKHALPPLRLPQNVFQQFEAETSWAKHVETKQSPYLVGKFNRKGPDLQFGILALELVGRSLKNAELGRCCFPYLSTT